MATARFIKFTTAHALCNASMLPGGLILNFTARRSPIWRPDWLARNGGEICPRCANPSVAKVSKPFRNGMRAKRSRKSRSYYSMQKPDRSAEFPRSMIKKQKKKTGFGNWEFIQSGALCRIQELVLRSVMDSLAAWALSLVYEHTAAHRFNFPKGGRCLPYQSCRVSCWILFYPTLRLSKQVLYKK